MVEDVILLLGETTFSRPLIELCIKQSIAEVEAYCNRVLDKELETIVERIAIIKLNRINSEGLSGQSYSGVNETYIDGYPADIMAVLNRKRRIKIL